MLKDVSNRASTVPAASATQSRPGEDIVPATEQSLPAFREPSGTRGWYRIVGVLAPILVILAFAFWLIAGAPPWLMLLVGLLAFLVWLGKISSGLSADARANIGRRSR